MYYFNTSYPKLVFLAELKHLVKFWDGLEKAVDETFFSRDIRILFSWNIGRNDKGSMCDLHPAPEKGRPWYLLLSRADKLMFR